MLKEVSVDTIHIVSKFTKEQKEELYGLIDFRKNYGSGYKFYWNGNAVYKHIIHCTQPFFMVFFEPRVGTGLWTKNHYDILISIQKEALQGKPALLQMIMQIGEWRVKRLDIAYDWLIPINEPFMWRNQNIKKTTFRDNQNFYLYGERSESRAVLYDKKAQLLKRKNIVVPEENLARLEIRIRPKLKQQSANFVDLTWLKTHLDKFIFVESGSELSRDLKTEREKLAFRALRRNARMDWEKYGGDANKRRIRKKAIEKSANLYELFLSHGLDKFILWNEKSLN